MAITINQNTYVITVPKADLALIQSSPTEVYELDSNLFRHWLDDILDSEIGIYLPKTHSHNTEVLIDGLAYARTIEILAPYTITFEDGQYRVVVTGSNNNIHSRTNVNQVSVQPSNSAGLINIRASEASSFFGEVILDTANGVAGTAYPTGTPSQPVNNIADAKLIASVRGLETITFRGNLTISATDDVHGYTIKGSNALTSFLTIEAGANVQYCRFNDLFMPSANMGGQYVYFDHVAMINVTNWQGFAEGCLLTNNISISAGEPTYLVDCKSGCVGLGTTDLPKINFAGASAKNVAFRNWGGPVKLLNSTNADNTVCIDIGSGATVIIDSTCTDGILYVRGVGNITDQTGATFVNGTGKIAVHHEAQIDSAEILDTILADSRTLTTAKFIALK